MATLELIWDRCHIYDLWSWSLGNIHQTARILRRIKNKVYTAHLGPRGLEPTQLVVIKAAHGEDELSDLTREADFYANELKYLQGSVVPQCYGFFRGKVDGVVWGCLLLEFCSGPPFFYLEESNQEIMLATCKIHEAGLIHGDLLDGHHILKMGPGIRIIDFSTATRHNCWSGIPVLMNCEDNHSDMDRVEQCSELANMERTYGLLGDASASRNTVRVMQRS